jgi:type IV pilus assembly protein PilW
MVARSGQRGLSLIELMISITIGLVILASLAGVLSANSGQSRTNDRTAELMTNGRYALNLLKQELRVAGFRGMTAAEPSAPGTLTGLTNECLEAGAVEGTFLSNIRQGVWGSDNANVFSGSCIPTDSYSSGNDVIVVRHVADASIESRAVSRVANVLYFKSSYSVGQVFQGVTSPPFPASTSPAPESFELIENVYYISPFTLANESPQIPALWRVALNKTNGVMAAELVASGIERMQVQYGLASGTVPVTRQYVDSLVGASWAPLTAGTSNATWDHVDSVRIWLLARNATAEPGYTNTNTYLMGNAPSYTPNDGYRRQMFSTVIQLRNRD